MDFLYLDEDIAVCVKPARVLSTDEPGTGTTPGGGTDDGEEGSFG